MRSMTSDPITNFEERGWQLPVDQMISDRGSFRNSGIQDRNSKIIQERSAPFFTTNGRVAGHESPATFYKRSFFFKNRQ